MVAAAGMHSGTSGYAQDLNHDGHISTSEKLMSGQSTSMGTNNFRSQDLNHDGYISTSEKLMSGQSTSMGTNDYRSQDLNHDGHISMSEKLASTHISGHDEAARLKLHEEQLAISKREVSAGEVDIRKTVHEQRVQETIPVRHEEVILERHALHGVAEPGARISSQDETMRVPLFREELVMEKRIVPTEEVIVRKKEVVDQETVGATLRAEHVETVQTGMYESGFQDSRTGFHDARDTNRDGHVSMGEKLQGSTLGTSSTGAFDARDTNRDGHLSMGEKFKGGALGGMAPKAARG